MISLLSLLTVTSCTPIVHGESAVTYLSFTPPTYLATEAGELFNVTIDVSNVQNLRNATFIVAYNASLLDVAQVLQGQFFPSPPRSRFEFKKDDVLGLVEIDMSLANPESPRSGNGTLACICFRVAASPAFPAYSPIEFQQTSLLDSASNPIIHDVGAAVYFWKLIQPDPPTQGRSIDLYTQKGGVGQNVPGGEFMISELVRLTSQVTYNDWPVLHKLVLVAVWNPLNQVVLVGIAVTDQNGFAELDLRISPLDSSIGEWTVLATVDIACIVVWDTLHFQVSRIPVVGGYSISIEERNITRPLSPYFALMAVLTISFIAVKRKYKRTAD